MYRAHAILSKRATLVVALLLVPAAFIFASESADLPAVPPDTSMPAFCFAPGTPPDVVARVSERAERLYEKSSLTPPSMLKYEIATRWSYTATDGGGLSEGDPTTLTWSVVPDGTSIGSGVGEPAGPSSLRAFLNGIYGDEAEWLAVFQRVFDRWGELTGITYVYESKDDGAALSYSSSGQLGVRADIRIGGHAIDGNYGILAYNYYPNNGDMVIDTLDSFFNDVSANSLKLRNTVAHEHGHGLGLAHSCPISKTKLMEPFLTTLFDGPQHDDILATNRSYGDRFEDNDTSGAAAPLGTFGSTTEANLSTDDNTDTDVYGFIVDAGAAVDVTVTPVGTTYRSGPQNSDGSCSAGTDYDSLNIQDLEVRVFDVDGSTVLAAADLNSVGQPEELDDIALSSGAGTYYVEITGDATDVAQLYQLSMTVSPSDQIFTDGLESGGTGIWSSTVP